MCFNSRAVFQVCSTKVFILQLYLQIYHRHLSLRTTFPFHNFDKFASLITDRDHERGYRRLVRSTNIQRARVGLLVNREIRLSIAIPMLTSIRTTAHCSGDRYAKEGGSLRISHRVLLGLLSTELRADTPSVSLLVLILVVKISY